MQSRAASHSPSETAASANATNCHRPFVAMQERFALRGAKNEAQYMHKLEIVCAPRIPWPFSYLNRFDNQVALLTYSSRGTSYQKAQVCTCRLEQQHADGRRIQKASRWLPWDKTHFGLAARLAMLGAVLQWQAEAAHLMP
jgi:hypothetical protein